MKKLSFLLAAALTFTATPYAARFGVVGGSLLLVVLGVLLAWAASESVSAMSAGFGAFGAFGGEVLATVSPAVGTAVLVALAYVERTTRVRNTSARVVHVGGALLGGGLAGTVSTMYASAAPAVRAVAILVAAVLIFLPLLIEADDPVAHALDGASADLAGKPSQALHDGAELRRSVHDALLDRDTAHRVGRTWRSLVRLAEARTRLQRSAAPDPQPVQAAVVEMLDQRIVDHVAALTRAYTAVDTAHAASVGLDDAALRSVEPLGESLDEVSQAMVEVRAEGGASPT